MALQIWLPLDGNLKNYGLLGWQPTLDNETTATYVNGKIGKALNTGGITMPAEITSQVLNNNTFSYACWFCATGATGSTSERAMIFGNNSMSTLGGRQFSLFQYSTANNLHWSWQNQNNGTYSSAYSGVLENVFPTNVWVHLAVVYNNPSVKIYINGQEKYSGSWISKTDSFNYNTTLIWNSSYHYLNDVRIYNHALSFKEVSELAKGLFLHYPLKDPYIESTINLCTTRIPGGGNQTWGGHTTVWTGVSCEDEPIPFDICLKGTITYSTNTSSGGGASRSIASFVVSPSTTYTYSFYAKATDDIDYISANFLYRYEFPAQGQTKILEAGIANKSRMISIGNGWYRFWGTFTTNSNTNYLQMSFYTYPCKNVTYWIGGWQLEEKDHMTPYIFGERNNLIVYDCAPAGNTYDGTVVGTITAAADSPKYETSYYFDGTSAINTSNPFDSNDLIKNFSISLWIKRNPLDGKTHHIYCGNMDLYSHTDNKLRIQWNHAADDLSYNNTNTWATGEIIPENQWTQIAFTFNAGVIDFYVNGKYIKTSDRSGTATNIRGYRGNCIGSYTNLSNPFIGNISDIRIYCTTLSAADIKELYDTAAQMDKNENIYAYEFKEY